MRPSRTHHEQLAIDALISSLAGAGSKVELDQTIVDRPDALLVVDGRRVAVECRIFSPQALLELHGYDWKLGEVYRIALPIEPHEWIRRAIDAKAAKVEVYRERTSANEVWLLCHFGTWLLQSAGGATTEFLTEGWAAGIERSDNKFDRIYIVDERIPRATCVFRNQLYQAPKERRTGFPREGLPVSIYHAGTMLPTRTPDGQAWINLNLQEPCNQIVLPPLDQRFVLREKDVASLDFRNVGNGNPYPQLYLKLPEPF